MVKRALLAAAILVAVSVAAPGAALAQDDDGAGSGASSRSGFGVGVILGEPMGATLKIYLDSASALQLHVAWDFTDEALAVFFDYLYHFDPIALESETLALPLYVGLGVRILQRPGATSSAADGSKFQFGLRLPIGIAAAFKKFPLEAFLEVAPGVRIISSIGFEIDAGIGARWYF